MSSGCSGLDTSSTSIFCCLLFARTEYIGLRPGKAYCERAMGIDQAVMTMLSSFCLRSWLCSAKGSSNVVCISDEVQHGVQNINR